MILSAQQLLSDQQAITATANSTNVIDLGVPGSPAYLNNPLNQDVGKGTPVCFLAQVTEDFNNLTSLTVALVVSDNSDLSAGTTLVQSTITAADLLAGKQVPFQHLPNGVDKRYLGLTYTVTGAAPTTGKVTAGITMGNQTNVTGA